MLSGLQHLRAISNFWEMSRQGDSKHSELLSMHQEQGARNSLSLSLSRNDLGLRRFKSCHWFWRFNIQIFEFFGFFSDFLVLFKKDFSDFLRILGTFFRIFFRGFTKIFCVANLRSTMKHGIWYSAWKSELSMIPFSVPKKIQCF